MQEYFSYLPNEIQNNIFKKINELNKLREYNKFYNILHINNF